MLKTQLEDMLKLDLSESDLAKHLSTLLEDYKLSKIVTFARDKTLTEADLRQTVAKSFRGQKILLSQLESFITFKACHNFFHALDFVDDPLFLETAASSMEIEEMEEEEIEVAEKIPTTLTGYLLLDLEGNVNGFTCFESQIQKGAR